MSCIKASKRSILHFMKLRYMYAAKKRDRGTQLKKNLEKVDAAIISVQHITRKVSSISVKPSISLDLLTQRCVEKQQLLKDLGQLVLALEALVACRQLMNSLCRRSKQLEKKEDDDYRIECVHEPSFEWGMHTGELIWLKILKRDVIHLALLN